MWPKNGTRSVTWLRILMDVLAVAICLSPRQAWAGFIDLTSPGDFQRALTQGLLTPVVQWNDDLEFHYPGQQALFRPASLSVDANGLVVDIGAPGDPPNVIGAWEYQIASAPPAAVQAQGTDLTNKKLIATVQFLDAGFSASIKLVDVNHKIRSWSYDFHDGLGTVTLKLDAAGGQQGADHFRNDPGFDVSQVLVSGGDHEARKTGVTTFQAVDIPEPSTIMLVVLGGAALVGNTSLHRKRPSATRQRIHQF